MHQSQECKGPLTDIFSRSPRVVRVPRYRATFLRNRYLRVLNLLVKKKKIYKGVYSLPTR